MDNIVANCYILDLFHLDTLAIVVGPSVSYAILEHARPFALRAIVAPRLILSFSTIVSFCISASESSVLSARLSSINVQGWTFNFEALDGDVFDVLDLDTTPAVNFEDWSGGVIKGLDLKMVSRKNLGEVLMFEIIWLANSAFVVVLVAVDTILKQKSGVLGCGIDCILKYITVCI